jgi:hypothetical protein
MTKYSIAAADRSGDLGAPVAERPESGSLAVGDPEACDLYAAGHQIHYTHQADAVHSASRRTRNAAVDGTTLTLVLDDGETLRWRHHDPARLERIIELLRGRCVVYREQHAVRVGPYWFNCAGDDDEWQDCRRAPDPAGP